MGTMISTAPKFDPAAVSRQIDAQLAAIPSSHRVALVMSADLPTRRGSAALMIRAGEHVAFVARVSKAQGGALEADANARISFLVGNPSVNDVASDPLPEVGFDEVVALLRTRGNGPVRARIKAWLALARRPVCLDPDGWLA